MCKNTIHVNWKTLILCQPNLLTQYHQHLHTHVTTSWIPTTMLTSGQIYLLHRSVTLHITFILPCFGSSLSCLQSKYPHRRPVKVCHKMPFHARTCLCGSYRQSTTELNVLYLCKCTHDRYVHHVCNFDCTFSITGALQNVHNVHRLQPSSVLELHYN